LVVLAILRFVLTAVVSAFIFGLAYALGAFALVWLGWQFTPESVPDTMAPQRQGFSRDISMLISFVYALVVGGFVGASNGVIHALIPPRGRDIWLSMAIGAGLTLALFVAAGPIVRVGLIWEAAAVLLSATISAICEWIARRSGIWSV
jgi:hypothetical protein